jgi:hypothetical protein
MLSKVTVAASWLGEMLNQSAMSQNHNFSNLGYA